MNYFEGIQAIRGDRHYMQQSQQQSRNVSNQATKLQVNRTHDMANCTLPASQGLKNLRSKQHDEFAVLNYYAKVSKYDLDRSNINMQRAKREKQHRRELNARAKREMI